MVVLQLLVGIRGLVNDKSLKDSIKLNTGTGGNARVNYNNNENTYKLIQMMPVIILFISS